VGKKKGGIEGNFARKRRVPSEERGWRPNEKRTMVVGDARGERGGCVDDVIGGGGAVTKKLGCLGKGGGGRLRGKKKGVRKAEVQKRLEWKGGEISSKCKEKGGLRLREKTLPKKEKSPNQDDFRHMGGREGSSLY